MKMDMTLNGVTYTKDELNFVTIMCDIEDTGVTLTDMQSGKNFTMCRAIVSAWTGEKDLNKCARMITEHVKSGGTLDDIFIPFREAMIDAGFMERPTEEEPEAETAEEPTEETGVTPITKKTASTKK